MDRPALLRQLDDGLRRPLTLLVAPAGSGKSVVLSQWADAHPELSWVWLDVDRADDDPVRFAQRLLGELAAVDPDCADLAGLTSMHGGGIGTPLLEALAAQLGSFPESVVVLDDLHHLSNPVLLADLGRLVGLLPPQVRLVLATRVDLPIAWSRHRLRSEMTELRQADLAMDAADSAELLERITGRAFDADSVSALVHRTEGWAAGLQLAAMTLRTRSDSNQFVAQFSGDDRLVADYLSEEVLRVQPEERRTLLLRISVLDEMCAELVAELTGEPAAQLLLEALERESMFLVPLDGRRQWYRFHHLFRDLLRFRLRAEQPGAEARLLADAAAWHLRRGDLGTAIDYLVGAEDWEGALRVILARGSEVFERGENATVIRWIAAIPEDMRAERHELNLLHGFLLGTEGQTAAADDVLRRVVADPRATDGELACAHTFRSAMVQSRSTPSTTLDMSDRALEALARLDGGPVPWVMNLSDAESLEAIAVASAGRAHALLGDTAEARRTLERTLTLPGSAYSLWKVHALGSLAVVEALCGRTDRAEALSTEALAVARAVGMLAHPAPADAFLAAALVALERGEPRRAALPLHEASVRFLANRRSQGSWICHLAMAMGQAAEGHGGGATTTVAAARVDLGTPPPPVVVGRLTALQCRLLRGEGRPEQSLGVVRAMVDPVPGVAVEHALATLALGGADVAVKALDQVAVPDEGLDPLAAVEHHLVRARAAEVQGSRRDADQELRAALEIAGTHRLVEAFVRAGPQVVAMVAALPDGHEGLRGRILERAGEVFTPPATEQLVDPLTDRELEILSYLPTRATNAELAERCYVSVNTIKTHMAHIYRKLDAPNRNAAIVRARELGLL